MRKSFNPNDCIGPLNTIKQGLQMLNHPFSKERMLTNLKTCGLPTNAIFWKIFRSVLKEVSKDKFEFASANPIHISNLIRMKTEYQETIKRYNQNRKNKQSTFIEEPVVVEEPIIESINEVQAAIDLLKKKGYLIFVPTSIQFTQV